MTTCKPNKGHKTTLFVTVTSVRALYIRVGEVPDVDPHLSVPYTQKLNCLLRFNNGFDKGVKWEVVKANGV